MGVDGGAGNAISLSEVQTFYGGSNPISMSEYYRGGSEVPSTATVVASNSDSGTTSATSGSVAAVVSNDSTSSTITGAGDVSFTIDTGSAGGSTVTISLTNNNTDEGQASLFRGGIQILATVGSTVTGTVNDGDSLTMSGSGNANPVFSYPRLTRVYDMTLTNNTGQTLNLTSSPWGNDSTFTNGEVKTADNQSSNSWSWSHPAVTGTFNTNVPASGTISMNIFNAPGTPGA